MKRELLVWLFFIVSLRVLSYSLCESAFSPKSGENSFLKPEKRLNGLYERFVNPNIVGEQRRYGADQEAHPSKISRKGGKSVYGGANDIKRPRPAHDGAHSFFIKPSSGFLVLLGHVVLPLLNLVIFF
ncbi:hypothetical protein I3842_16G104600 [Carya illinoinensis]|uniref:Uncharacterized protein n=1 Tax=Carya illinoinensis TaxID=32201 RepID=A0A922A8Y5_CARIL|nr:hypothetical protein I3842_16G104600 [Carya illinoinensis]